MPAESAKDWKLGEQQLLLTSNVHAIREVEHASGWRSALHKHLLHTKADLEGVSHDLEDVLKIRAWISLCCIALLSKSFILQHDILKTLAVVLFVLRLFNLDIFSTWGGAGVHSGGTVRVGDTI